MAQARVLEALKTGRAAVPMFGFGVDTSEDATGQTEVDLPAGRRKVWAAGDYVIFSKPTADQFNDIRRRNSGGSASGVYAADGNATGGTNETSVDSVVLADTKVLGDGYTVSSASEAAQEAVYQSWRAVYSATPPADIVYTFANCERQEYVVRLHFAEMEFDGIAENSKMTVTLEGATTIIIPDFVPSDEVAVLTPVILERRLRPNAAGTIVVTITAQANALNGNYNAFVNAVELLSYTWETRLLISGSNASLLKWTGRLMGNYPEGSTVRQLLFGVPSVDDMTALSDYYADLNLTVSEPVGTGDLSEAGTCPPEICDDDEVVWTGSTPYELDGCADTQFLTAVDDIYFWDIAVGTNPNDVLTLGELACAKNIADERYALYVTEHPGYTYTKGPYIWVWHGSGSNGVDGFKSGRAQFESGECTAEAVSEWDNTITAFYYMSVAFCKVPIE